MGFFRKKILKLGNKGLSMVELICGITMLTIIGSSICSVMAVSADTYKRGSAEASVQQEAQLVANQISDLLIDSTDEVVFDGTNKVLTVKQGTRTYKVSLVGNTLYYEDSDESDVQQIMAEGVNHFVVDTTDFAQTGCAKLELKFADDSDGQLETAQAKPMNFNITSRNKETNTVNVVATVSMIGDWLLEPGQKYDFNPVINPAGVATATFSIDNNTSMNTKINATSGLLEIGVDEKSPIVRVVCNVEQSGTVIAIKYANVYVRQVLDVKPIGTYNPITSTGAEKKNGAKYDLSVTTMGNSLGQITGKDYDKTYNNNDGSDDYKYRYVDPYTYDWSAVSSGPTPVSVAIEGGKPVLTLGGDMQTGEEITVTVRSKHADGANRENIDYGDVTGVWKLPNTASIFGPGGGWLRNSDQPQTTLTGTIQTLQQQYGGDWKFSFRYKEDGAADWELADTYADGWMPNIYGGDGNGSMTINLRPLFTSSMDYWKAYDVQIRVTLEDGSGNVLWPASDAIDVNILAGHVDKVQVAFNSTPMGFPAPPEGEENTTARVANTEADAEEVSFTYADGVTNTVTLLEMYDIHGVEKDDVYNQFVYKLQKKDASGEYKDVTSGFEYEDQYTKNCKIKFRDANFEGDYRIIVDLKEMPQYDLSNNANLPKITYELNAHDPDEAVFYFKAVKSN